MTLAERILMAPVMAWLWLIGAVAFFVFPGNDQQMHRVAEMADAPRPRSPASGQAEHGGDGAGSSPAPVPNAPAEARCKASPRAGGSAGGRT